MAGVTASGAPQPEAGPGPTAFPPLSQNTGGHLEEPSWSRALLGLRFAVAPEGPAPIAWLLEADGSSAFLEEDSDAPAPFEQHRTVQGWWVRRDPHVLEPVARATFQQAGASSGLVTLWQDAQSRCLLDVIAVGTVALDGPPVAVGYTISDIVVELASRRWCDPDDVWLVGFGRQIEGLSAVRYLTTLDAAITVLEGSRSFETGRSRILVIAPMPVDEGRRGTLRRLLRLVEQTPLSGAICCDTSASAHCTWRVAAHRQTLCLEVGGRAGVSATIAPRGSAERDEISRPVLSSSPSPVTSSAATGTARPDRAADEPSPPSSPESTPGGHVGGVEVLLLGPVQIVGAAESLESRPILKELVAYLSLHPEGATGDACAAVLWPDRRVPPQTLSNRLHEARRALGRDQEGSARLTRCAGRHILSCDVTTDWSRFVETTGKRSGPSDWRRALTLVRGRPFGTLARGDWAIVEGYSSLIEDRVVEVASRLAAHLLHDGDHGGATWAVRQGLAVAPWDERLYRLLMVACDAAGNRGGVEAALRSLARTLEWTGRPLDGVHPVTAALYRRLTGTTGF